MGDSLRYDLSTTPIPLPWAPGQELQLEILKNFRASPFQGNPGQPLTATVAEILSVTMSSVMRLVMSGPQVSSGAPSHPKQQAVLKLYDRRFGTDLRDYRYRHVPLTAARESAFHKFVRQRKIAPFLDEWVPKKRKAEMALDARPCNFLDDCPEQGEPKDPEGDEMYEAALWQLCGEQFDAEAEAYERLKDQQGKTILRMYAHVRLVFSGPDVPQNLVDEPDTARYFEVRGTLLEFVDGYNLSEIWWSTPLKGGIPADPREWQHITQEAVDAVYEMNKRGISLDDCQPRNVMVDRHTQKPFIIDFGVCEFKDRLIQLWMENDWLEEEDPEVRYWESVISTDNPGAIGAIARHMIKQKKGIQLEIKFPDVYKVLVELKQSKGIEPTEAEIMAMD
ncbi:hypothetical protein N0V88_000571 [Collariella sp. IMI 366227]|nr:hypothetical protein N0V88_000571 [Collariella sp. IMI 366227]